MALTRCVRHLAQASTFGHLVSIFVQNIYDGPRDSTLVIITPVVDNYLVLENSNKCKLDSFPCTVMLLISHRDVNQYFMGDGTNLMGGG